MSEAKYIILCIKDAQRVHPDWEVSDIIELLEFREDTKEAVAKSKNQQTKAKYLEGLGLPSSEQIEVLKKFCKDHNVTAVSCDAGFLEANLTAQLQKLIDDPNVVYLDEKERKHMVKCDHWNLRRCPLCKSIKEKLGD